MLIRSGINAAEPATIPTLATDGVRIRPTTTTISDTLWDVDEPFVGIRNTAGTGALTVTIELWGWSELLLRWYPFATITVSTTVLTDTLRSATRVPGFRDFTRIYARCTAIGGTTPAYTVEAWTAGHLWPTR